MSKAPLNDRIKAGEAGPDKGKDVPPSSDETVRFSAAGVSWVVREGWREKLPPDFFNRLVSGEEVPGCSLVKEHGARKVLFMGSPEPGGKGLFIKCHNHRGLGQALRYLVTPSKALKEWRSARALEEEGLPTGRALGYGERRRMGFLRTSYYLSESIDEGIDLHRWWVSGDSGGALCRRGIIDQLAILLRAMHDRNFFPTDFHAGNVIVSSGENGRHSLQLIDLDGVRMVRRLKKSHRLSNLVQVHNEALQLSLRDKLRFLRAYAEEGSPLHKELLSEMGKLVELTRRFRERQYRRRTRRCLAGKYIFGKRKVDRFTVYHQPDFEPEAALRVIADYRAAAMVEGIRFLKTDHSRTILTLPLPGSGGAAASGEAEKRVCMKHFRYQGPLRVMKDLFRTSKGRRSWVAGNAFFLRGIPTGKPLALVEERRWGLPRESFLIMQDLSRFSGVHRYVLDNFEGLASPGTAARRRFTVSLADSLLDLHRMGVYHRDLKSSNILVEESGEGWRFHYIDLDGAAIGRKVSLRRRAKNLAQIETSTPGCMTLLDRIRFFLHYLEGMDPPPHRRAFLRRVLAEIGRRGRAW